MKKTVLVRYFAILREQRGLDEEQVATSASTAGELYEELARRHGFTLPASRLRVAVNDEFVALDVRAPRGRRARLHPAGRRRMSTMEFTLTPEPIEPKALIAGLDNTGAGACVTFEGRVRDTNEGRGVTALDYEAYGPLAEKEGAKIMAEAREKFRVLGALCVHRTGSLALGDLAVWVAVTAAHRDAAFAACRYIIDEVKARLPIWKKEHYAGGAAEWVNGASRGPADAGTVK